MLDAAALLPLVSPPFTTSIAIIFSFGPKGFITHDLLGLTNVRAYGLWSTTLAETLTYFPIAYLTLRPILAAIDPNLEEMAFSLGGSRWRIFRTVTLPLAVPGFANAFLLLFAASLADFATPLILAGNSFPVLPTQAYLQITGMFDFKGGAVLSLMLLVPATAVFLLQRYWVGRRTYVTVTGKVGQRSRTRAMAPWAGMLLVAACFVVAAIILYFYALLLFASLVVAFGANNSFTWHHYQVIFTEGLPAIRDTLIIAAIGMPLGGFYGVLVGYLIARRSFPGRQRHGAGVDDQLRAARHHRRHRLSDRLQRSAAGADRRRADHHRLLRLPLQPDRHPRHRGAVAADRPQHRGGLVQPGRGQRRDLPARDPAADRAGLLRRAGRRLHPLHDGDQRHHLPGVDQLDADHRAHPGEHDRDGAGAGGRLLGVRDRRGVRRRGRPQCRAGAAARAGGRRRRPHPSWEVRRMAPISIRLDRISKRFDHT